MDGDHSAGGSRALLGAIDKAGSALYADLLREYGFDLLDLFREDPPSPKYILGLVENLPPHSQTSNILRDTPEGFGWDTSSYLLASIVNSVREGTFANMQVRTKKKLSPPEPVFTPGTEKQKKNKPNKFVQMAQAQLAKRQRSM